MLSKSQSDKLIQSPSRSNSGVCIILLPSGVPVNLMHPCVSFLCWQIIHKSMFFFLASGRSRTVDEGPGELSGAGTNVVSFTMVMNVVSDLRYAAEGLGAHCKCPKWGPGAR